VVPLVLSESELGDFKRSNPKQRYVNFAKVGGPFFEKGQDVVLCKRG
jgi:hypothetical protein